MTHEAQELEVCPGCGTAHLDEEEHRTQVCLMALVSAMMNGKVFACPTIDTQTGKRMYALCLDVSDDSFVQVAVFIPKGDDHRYQPEKDPSQVH